VNAKTDCCEMKNIVENSIARNFFIGFMFMRVKFYFVNFTLCRRMCLH
jgi:hypothetical protein